MSTEQTAETKTTKQVETIQDLLQDQDVRRWYDSLGRASKATADVRVRRLFRFCQQYHFSPQGLATLDPTTLSDALDDAVKDMDERGWAPGYVKSTLTALKSWLGHKGIQPKRKIRIRNADIPVTLADEAVPQQEELTQILATGSLKSRVVKQLMAKCGLRPCVLGNFDGTDGARLSDLADLVLLQGKAAFTRHPPILTVRETLSKNRRRYSTFLSPAAEQAVTAYLNARMASGEALSLNSPLVRPDRSRKEFLIAAGIGREVRESLRNEPRRRDKPRKTYAGPRPYVLRAFFSTQLVLAEDRGPVSPTFREYWLGHTGGVAARYNVGKQRLAPELIEEMRTAYARAVPFLDLETPVPDKAEQQRRQLQNTVALIPPNGLGEALELVEKFARGEISAQHRR